MNFNKFWHIPQENNTCSFSETGPCYTGSLIKITGTGGQKRTLFLCNQNEWHERRDGHWPPFPSHFLPSPPSLVSFHSLGPSLCPGPGQGGMAEMFVTQLTAPSKPLPLWNDPVQISPFQWNALMSQLCFLRHVLIF